MTLNELMEMRDSLKTMLKKVEEEISLTHLISWRSKVDAGYIVPAILQYAREHPGISLKESKEIIDSYLNMECN